MPERKKVAPTASRMPNSISDKGKRPAAVRSMSSRAIRLLSCRRGSNVVLVMVASQGWFGRRPGISEPARSWGGWCRCLFRTGPGAAADGCDELALGGGERAADDLLAGALRDGEPGA